MTNENQRQTLEGIALLSNLDNVNQSTKLYEESLKNGNSSLSRKASENASKLITNGSMDDLLLNATPQAWNYEIENYKNDNSDRFEEAFNKSKEDLLKFYSGYIDKLKEIIIDKANGDNKLDSEEKKKEFTKINMYMNLASMLSDFNLKPDYNEDEELANAYKIFKDFKEAKPEELSRKTADAMTAMNGLSKNARNLKNDWSPYANEVKSIYGRILAKRLLNDELELNKEKFSEAFETRDNYAQIASTYLKALSKQQAGE